MSAKSEKKKRKLYTVANAHLDTQWNWDIQATIRDCVKNTLERNFALLDKYPGYRFNFEGAFRYKLAKEYYPDLYERLKGYIADGRWNVAGSSWDACDVNVPSSEALMRQILLGNGYFEKEFGKKSSDIFLTDCFGFSYALPSVEAHMGLNGFSTQKLGWGLGTPVLKDGKVLKPFKGEGDDVRMDIGRWRGPDGKEVFVALDPGGYGYNFREGDNETPVNMRENYEKQLENNEKTVGVGKKMIYYGTGDYGGSPDPTSAKMISEALAATDGEKYEVVSSSTDQIFNEFTPDEAKKLPVYDGELLIPHGYGAFSSRTINKRWNRKNELLADCAEKAACAATLLSGAKYPSERLDFAWKQFLWHQFHDDLPGTSIPSAYKYSHNDYVVALNIFARELQSSVAAVAKTLDTDVSGVPVVVFNPVSKAVHGLVEAKVDVKTPYVTVCGADGKEVPAQIKDGVVKFVADVPSVGFAVYSVCGSEKKNTRKSKLSVSKSSLENERYKVKIDKNGDIASIYDKKIDKELLDAPAQLCIFPDESRNWPSWEIDYSSFTAEPKCVAGKPEIEITDDGAAVVSLKITRKFGSSRFTQVVSLSDGGQRVDVNCNVEWRERRSLLKAVFPFAAKNENADFDIGLGAISRGNSNSAPYYEYTHNQWADITDKSGEFGVSLINDCKYGIDKPNDGTLRLTLIHTPSWGAWLWSAQCLQDFGTNIFSYSICSHDGFRTEIPAEAAAMNEPLIPFITAKHGGAKEFSLVETSGNKFIVKAVKKEEKGDRLIVRVQEMTGKGVKKASLKLVSEIIDARETNGYETDLAAAEFDKNTLSFNLKPYEVKTFAISLNKADSNVGNALTATVLLPYDKHITSANGKSATGDFFGGISIPEEIFDENITVGGIPFTLGAKNKNNGMICAGQTVKLPAGAKKLWILAAANGDRSAEFSVDGKPVSAKIQDFGENVGQWDLIGMNTNARIKRDDIAVTYTHTHDAEGDRRYLFAYLFAYSFDVDGASTFTFPKDENIIIAAATATMTDCSDTSPARFLYDSTDGKTVKMTVVTPNGEEIKEVTAGSTVVLETSLKYDNGKVFKAWSGDGIVFADATRAIVAVGDKDVTFTAESVDFGENLIENKPCRTNIMYEGFEKPENALDGTGKRRWTSKLAEDGTAVLEVMLRGEHLLSRWLVEGCGAREGFGLNARDYRLEYRSRREEDWKVADEVKNNENTLTVREFTPVKARMVRLVVTDPTSVEHDHSARIQRFFVGGERVNRE